MRHLLVLLPLLAAVSCSEGNQAEREKVDQSPSVHRQASPPPPEEASADLQVPDHAGGPNVPVTAAPGVAFNYRYAFRLPAERVAPVQEQHASMCEKLGPNRCRITGMLYRVLDDDDIEARLSLKLEPSIARRFGQEGVEAVLRADGGLVESEISGTDAGATIREAGRSIAQMRDELRRIEAQLARRGASEDERSRLEHEAQQLRGSIAAAQDNRLEAQESLATTPMTFEYGAGDVGPSLNRGWPVRQTLERAGDNFVAGISILFIILVTMLPWVALGLLIWLLARFLRRRGWIRRMGGEEVAPAAG